MVVRIFYMIFSLSIFTVKVQAQDNDSIHCETLIERYLSFSENNVVTYWDEFPKLLTNIDSVRLIIEKKLEAQYFDVFSKIYVGVIVNERGSVECCKILNIRVPLVNETIKDYVVDFQFSPAKVNGQAVKSFMVFLIYTKQNNEYRIKQKE